MNQEIEANENGNVENELIVNKNDQINDEMNSKRMKQRSISIRKAKVSVLFY